MTDDEVVHAVQALVAAGEYLDDIPGVPGARLSGAGSFEGNRRLYRRGSPEHLEARAAGLVDRLPPLTPASPAAVQEAEGLLGHRLPWLLRRLYLEVGNGGFGPGYGILGVRGGHPETPGDDYHHTAVDLYRQARSGSLTKWRSMPAALLPVCYWGCGIYSLIDCADPQATMWAWDPNPAPHDDIGKALFPQSMTFGEWLVRWIDRRLHQPALVQDPDTGSGEAPPIRSTRHGARSWRGCDVDSGLLIPLIKPHASHFNPRNPSVSMERPAVEGMTA
jgi:hypothetical protein